ncbi:4-aminobutyrate--2-oxoglutarate transaminase [Peribacillus saganii]|uniref:(S)-3-amino-2-methylpropionate transaminase n=1 Tax=Peribacillus saganii TaxID=2303992 RepID=A0A372LR92_9BACI|nr:4-aminobutyrate--2-oxoglutarate transaminase [Peribacillus saganii]RFU70292.1 4-aminobutyrate--2-oxoglutarate transaminase [Peribacillus saganii]
MGDIKLKTSIPGPRSTELLKQREEAIARGISTALPIVTKKASGALLTDIDDNCFIDMAAGIGSLNVGHSPEKVVGAIREQLNNFINPIFNVTMHEPYIRLAQTLNNLIPGDFPKKTVLFNSGAEAVENAVKIARRYTGRRAIISFERGFHGRSLLAMTLTSKVKGIKSGFGPLATDVYRLPYPYYYRDQRTDKELLENFQTLFQYSVDPNDVAAVILEPVQGDGGIIAPSVEFVQGVKEICSNYGILLIADEVQTGFGRTGKWFGMEHFHIYPDITVISKSIAAGIPLSAVTGRSEIVNYPEVTELGGTLGGNPLGCVAALKVIEMIENEKLLERANFIGEQIKSQLNFPSKFLGDVRGLGAMVGMEFVKDKKKKEPNGSFAARVSRGCHERGVITFTAGAHGNVIRLLPPLVITNNQLMEALDVIVDVIQLTEKSDVN